MGSVRLRILTPVITTATETGELLPASPSSGVLYWSGGHFLAECYRFIFQVEKRKCHLEAAQLPTVASVSIQSRCLSLYDKILI